VVVAAILVFLVLRHYGTVLSSDLISASLNSPNTDVPKINTVCLQVFLGFFLTMWRFAPRDVCKNGQKAGDFILAK